MRYQSRSNSNSRGESIAKRSLRLCVPRTSSALNSWRNRLTSAHYDRAGTIFPVPCGLATQAEVAACSRERGTSTSVDRFAAQDARPSLAHEQRSLVLYPDVRWFPSILQVLTIIRPETLVRWHRAGFRYYWRWKSRSLG